jgi:O-antigen ligase/polysaccharide polymerase Wzy-like membrane protein
MIFVVEVILGGPFGIYDGIPVRFLLLGASCAVLLFAIVFRGRVSRAHALPVLSIVGFLFLNGVWVAIVPALMGTDMHWSLREPNAFIVLVLVVLILALLPRDQVGETLTRLQRIVVLTAVVLALFQITLWIFGTLLPGLRWIVPLALGLVFPGGSGQLYVGTMPDGFFRVFWISTLWCLLGFFWAPPTFAKSRVRMLIRAVLLMDLFIAYSRGIWVGLVLGLAVAFVATLTHRDVGRRLFRSTLAAGVALAALIAALGATGSLERGLGRLRSTASREDQSINARVEQAPYLLELWEEHPLLGSGYGAYAPTYIRSEESPYSYEHMPFALLAKLGLIGIAGCGLFVAAWAFTAWEARARAPAQVASFLGAGVALLVSEMTNPMVLNFVSMSIFACLLLQWATFVLPVNAVSARPPGKA